MKRTVILLPAVMSAQAERIEVYALSGQQLKVTNN
jgi:hypothetical protein